MLLFIDKWSIFHLSKNCTHTHTLAHIQTSHSFKVRRRHQFVIISF